MNLPRFVIARSHGDTVILHDNVKLRMAAIFPRDNSLPQDKAEAAALAMAETCAHALNLRCEAAKNGKETDGRLPESTVWERLSDTASPSSPKCPTGRPGRMICGSMIRTPRITTSGSGKKKPARLPTKK